MRLRIVAPAIFLENSRRRRKTPSVRRCRRPATDRSEAAKRSVVKFGLRTLIAEPVLHLHRQSAAERVQAEHGLRPGQHLHAIDCRHGNEIPIDRIAERIVDAHAVLIDGQSLRQSQERRCGETAKVEVGLQRVVLSMIDAHAAELPVQEVAQVERLRALQLLRRWHAARLPEPARDRRRCRKAPPRRLLPAAEGWRPSSTWRRCRCRSRNWPPRPRGRLAAFTSRRSSRVRAPRPETR